MPHLALLGDSVIDNGAYTNGGPAVIEQVSAALPTGWRATMVAIDGSTTAEIADQIARLPADVTHLLLSVGGNDALMRADLLDTPVPSSAQALLLLHEASQTFEQTYRAMLTACMQPGLPLTVCTIYHGNFPDPAYQACVATALCVFNDVILRIAREHGLTVLDIRAICNTPDDYANPIEPSSHGGAKLAAAIVRTVAGPSPAPGARLVA